LGYDLISNRIGGSQQMGTGAAVHGEVGAFAPAAESSGVRWRWLALIVAVVLAFGAAYAIGSASKSKSAAPQTDATLAPAVSLAAPHAAVTALRAGVAVPGLKALPKRPKRKPASGSGTTATSSTPSTGVTPSSGVVASQAPVSSAPAQSSAPAVSSTPSSSTPSTGVTHSSGGSSSSSGGSSGVTHGGG
jgi:hypothetical protein